MISAGVPRRIAPIERSKSLFRCARDNRAWCVARRRRHPMAPSANRRRAWLRILS